MSFLVDIVRTVLSPWGLMAVLLGFVTFLVTPILGSALGNKRLANFNLWLALWMLRRPAVVISEHGEPLLKKMQFDSLGVEKIDFADETKEFDDPNAALHSFFGFPFALAYEPDGFLFDPRHAYVGAKKHAAQQRGEYVVDASTAEWREFEVSEWMRGVFAAPGRKHALPNLTDVHRLKFGGERAEYSQRVEKLYEKMLAELEDGSGRSIQYLMIIAALVVPFAACWLIASQGGASVGGSTVSGLGGTVVVGTLLMAAAPAPESGSDGGSGGRGVNWRKLVGLVLLVVVPVGLLGAIGVLFGIGVGLAIAVLFAIGLAIVPGFAFFIRLVGFGSEGLARKFFGFGLKGYREPVFEWTPESYRLAEADSLDLDDGMTSWYSLCGSRVGFSFEPGERSWGAELMSHDDVDSYRHDAVTDGGEVPESQIPATHAPAPDLSRGRVGGFLPKTLRRETLYLHSGIVLERFEDSAMGQKALNRLLWAKENHDGKAISDTTLVYMTVGCGVLSFIAGIVVFFLL